MDKRTLIFVISLSLTLFAVNLFFEQRNVEDKRKWSEQQAAKKEVKIKELQKEVALRTASLDQLPVVAYYLTDKGGDPKGYGVLSGDGFITLSGDKSLPEMIYVATDSSNKTLSPLNRSNVGEKSGDPVVYLNQKGSKIASPSVPLFGKYDLQLVKFSGAERPKVVLGEYVNGQFSVPEEQLKSLDESNTTEDQGDYIVLIQSENKYLPVGVYHSNSHTFNPLDSIVSLADMILKPREKSFMSNGQKQEEKFYVLETPYQQLVFSNYGAALAEINLPFKSQADSKSVVKPIEIDREMVEYHPYNARFPAHPYYTPGKTPTSFEEHSIGELGGYYPLLRRDLIEQNPQKNVKIKPKFYAMNIVSEYPETAELVYNVKSFEKDKIVFEATQGHRKITKTFSVSSEAEGPYSVDLMIQIEGDSRGLWITSGIPEVELFSGSPAPVLKYRITRNGKSEVVNMDLPKEAVTMSSVNPDWVCDSNGFFGIILDPLSDTDPGMRAQMIPGQVVPSRLVEIDEEYHKYEAQNMPGYMYMLPLKSTGGTMHFRAFAGPFAGSVLKEVDKVYSNAATGYNPDYIACQSFHGWFAFISEPFAKFLFILMTFFHSITGSWAFSIILLTVALRIMLWPLNAWSTKSMVKMQQIAPDVTAIQEKYKNDPKKAQLEIMNLYRDKGVNPVSGCFPLLIQMPFLIGMFDLLKSTFELRGASFIPGWIDDLAAPDVLFSWKMPIFFIGNQFHLLPILLGGVMLLQQRYMSTAPKDPSQMTEQQRQQRVMGNMMAVVFTVMFYHFPSGLNIYWLSSMLLGMFQQYWTAKTLKNVSDKTVKTPTKSK